MIQPSLLNFQSCETITATQWENISVTPERFPVPVCNQSLFLLPTLEIPDLLSVSIDLALPDIA